MQAVLTDSFQTGGLAGSLGLEVTGLALEEPLQPPTQPEVPADAGDRGSVPLDGVSYAERSQRNDSLLLEKLLEEVDYDIPTALKISMEPFVVEEMMAIRPAPKLYLVNSENKHLAAVGDSSSPWLVEASLLAGSGHLLGNTTAPVTEGFASFDRLMLDQAGKGNTLSFKIVRPEVTIPPVVSLPFEVGARPLGLQFTNLSSLLATNQTFLLAVSLWDLALDSPASASSLASLSWQCHLSLLPRTTQIQGHTTVAVPRGNTSHLTLSTSSFRGEPGTFRQLVHPRICDQRSLHCHLRK